MKLIKFVVERELPNGEIPDDARLKAIAADFNRGVGSFSSNYIVWLESHVASGKMFCVFLANSEATIHKHAGIVNLPNIKITKIQRTIDPTT